MSRTFVVGAVLTILLAGPAFAQGDTKKKPPTDQQIAELIKKLGDVRFRIRDHAHQRLIQIGKPALPQLNKAAQSKEPEIQVFARKIILEIEVAELIAKLGDVRFKVRQGAHQRLVKIGRPALPQLRKAVASEEVEIRMRAAKIIKEIEALMETGIRFVPRASNCAKERSTFQKTQSPLERLPAFDHEEA